MKASVSSGASPWAVEMLRVSLLGLRSRPQSSADRPIVLFGPLLSMRA